MKKFLQFSGLIAAVVAIVAFILLLACPSMTYTLGNSTSEISGIYGIFGGKITASGWGISVDLGEIKATASAVIAFVLLIVAIVILLLGAILPVFKVTALNKFSGLLNLIAVIALVAAGILVFIEVPCYCAAQSTADYTLKTDGYALGAGWIVAAICAIVAGVLAVAPSFANFIAKGKKK